MAESSVTFFLEKLSNLVIQEAFSIWRNREVAHDAEDVIDEFILNMDHQSRKAQKSQVPKRLPTCVGFADKLPFIHDSTVGEGDQCHDREDMVNRSKRADSNVEETDVVEIKMEEVVKQMLIKEDR
ncbi:hypothetical protein CK203_041105 [Vitis vinifera]|uniref:Uncharacterized protein n=1 Tax=Vitis vinifera TaxID=29760 RepID=A0A438H9W6_VITVI|nr:hypothetical protein CK203_041105 [Vitis vinifera]